MKIKLDTGEIVEVYKSSVRKGNMINTLDCTTEYTPVSSKTLKLYKRIN